MKRTVAMILIFLVGCLTAPALSFAQMPVKRMNSAVAFEARLIVLEKRLSEIGIEIRDLSRQRRKSLADLSNLNREISKLKADPDRGFLGDVKLQRLLSDHLELSKQVEKLENKKRMLLEQREKVRSRISATYDSLISGIVSAMDKEKDRAKQLDLVHRYFDLSEKAKKFQPKDSAKERFGAFSVKLDLLDGPRQISEKADLIRDRIVKLRLAIKQIEKRIAKIKSEKRLAEEMRNLIEERNLFEDGVRFAPSPRSLPVRRPDESGQDGATGAGDESDFDSAGVHTSPVAGAAESGRAFMLGAIDSEIKRLEAEKKLLLELIAGLELKLKLFLKKAGEVSAIDPPTGRMWTTIVLPPKGYP